VTKPLAASEIEQIHDVVVAIVLPYDEKILPNEYRDTALIESAAGRPFHTLFGEEAFPTLASKAAALFHALVCNHCFFNGNKRTAVVSLDIFLGMNNAIFVMASEDVYEMAKTTAKANEEGRPLSEVMADLTNWIGGAVFDVDQLKAALSGLDPASATQTSTGLVVRWLGYLTAALLQKLKDESPL